jgi:predicted nicotinamide N-methyase
MSSNTQHIKTVLSLNLERTFDVIIASDCLFFKDFHVDLIQTLKRLLAPNGTCILLQPERDHTMSKFIDLSTKRTNEDTPIFDVEVFEDYNPQVKIIVIERSLTLKTRKDMNCLLQTTYVGVRASSELSEEPW